MADYASNSFMYNGERYTFLATLYNLIDGKREKSCALDIMALDKFEYTNELNDLLLRGSITYTDKHGLVDQFIEEQFAYCEISLVKNEERSDGQISVSKFSGTDKLEHIFLIDSIEILSRQKSIVSYQINLVSVNWFNCVANITYSTYGSGSREVFSILQSCMQMVSLVPDAKSFDRVKSNVSLNYITAGDDCLLSIFKYLMRRLYYLQQRDDSLKFLVYNEQANSYQLFDAKNSSPASGQSELIVSFFKTSIEHMAQQEPINFGIVTKTPKSKFLPAMFSQVINSFDYDTNKFSEDRFGDDVNASYLTNKFDMPKTRPKFSQMVQMENKTFLHRASYWSNQLDTYHDFQQSLFECNALVVNAIGELSRKPGSIVTIAVDRSSKDLNGDRTEDLDRLNNRYKAFEGPWFASRVRHIIEPNRGPEGNGSYRQNIVLFRNFQNEAQQEKKV